VQVDPIKPTPKAPGPSLLTLKCDEPLSTFAFNLNLRRFVKSGWKSMFMVFTTAAADPVGRCRLTL